jgi:hypothetical protein
MVLYPSESAPTSPRVPAQRSSTPELIPAPAAEDFHKLACSTTPPPSALAAAAVIPLCIVPHTPESYIARSPGTDSSSSHPIHSTPLARKQPPVKNLLRELATPCTPPFTPLRDRQDSVTSVASPIASHPVFSMDVSPGSSYNSPRTYFAGGLCRIDDSLSRPCTPPMGVHPGNAILSVSPVESLISENDRLMLCMTSPAPNGAVCDPYHDFKVGTHIILTLKMPPLFVRRPFVRLPLLYLSRQLPACTAHNAAHPGDGYRLSRHDA